MYSFPLLPPPPLLIVWKRQIKTSHVHPISTRLFLSLTS